MITRYRFAIVAIGLSGMFSGAHALELPGGSRYDNRIQSVVYNPRDVVRLAAREGMISRIVLERGETILKHGTGFPGGWILSSDAAAPNILFVHPQAVPGEGEDPPFEPEPEVWSTNLAIITDKREYDLDLVLLDENTVDDAQGLAYRIGFTYPQAEEASARKSLLEDLNQGLEDPVFRCSPPVIVNDDYTYAPGERSSAILPDLADDDGLFTRLGFPGNAEFPSVYLLGDDGTAQVAEYHVDRCDPGVMVIHSVSPRLLLRLGQMVVTVYNEAYDRVGRRSDSGTSVPGLVRRPISEDTP